MTLFFLQREKGTFKIQQKKISLYKKMSVIKLDTIEDLQKYPEVKINLVGRAGINEWMSITKPQIIIKDYEVLNGELAF